jgi:hypothetical protein
MSNVEVKYANLHGLTRFLFNRKPSCLSFSSGVSRPLGSGENISPLKSDSVWIESRGIQKLIIERENNM